MGRWGMGGGGLVVVGILIVGHKPHIHERKGILSHEGDKCEGVVHGPMILEGARASSAVITFMTALH